VIFQTVKDVALCSAVTLAVVGFCMLGRLAGWGRSP
jgi:hypothetical protein